MKFLFLFVLAALIAIAPSLCHAEGGCPEGQYPQEGPGWRSCVPIPGYDNAPPAQRPRIKDQWGALSVDPDHGVIGVILTADTKKEASEAATKDCKSKGGKECTLMVSVLNECFAMYTGNKNIWVKPGLSKSEAERNTLEVCQKDDSDCQRYFAACSAPIIIQ